MATATQITTGRVRFSYVNAFTPRAAQEGAQLKYSVTLLIQKTASNIEEIKARGGKVITVIAKGDEQVRKSSDYFIEVPVVAECLMPIVVSVPLQLLAYHIAVNKGRDVDQPRNLAKSVTVE